MANTRRHLPFSIPSGGERTPSSQFSSGHKETLFHGEVGTISSPVQSILLKTSNKGTGKEKGRKKKKEKERETFPVLNVKLELVNLGIGAKKARQN